MHKIKTWILILAALLMFAMTGCATRYITTTYAQYSPKRSSVYIFYWEGKCWGAMCIGRGESKVKRCDINDDNTLTCHMEEEATQSLNPE